MSRRDASVRVGEAIPRSVADARVLDASGAPVRVGSLWEAGPCAIVLLRHFGCVGCATQVRELAPRLFELHRAGIRTVLVGNGSLEQRAAFVERHGLEGAPVEILTDPNLDIYRAMWLVRSAWATVGPRALVQIALAMAAGQPHRPIEGDATQQGGALVVDGAGVLRFFHRNQSLGDHAAASDLVAVALGLAVEASGALARV
jgi:peroxiredoxin